MKPCKDHGRKGNKGGYSYGTLNGKRVGRHVMALIRATGELPNGRVARHTCDNSRCIEPTHLIWGTHKDNLADMLERGRGNFAHGLRAGKSVFTEEQVRDIRSTYKPYDKERGAAALARKYGVSNNAILLAARGDTYKDVDGPGFGRYRKLTTREAQIRTLETQLKDSKALSTEMSKAAWTVGFAAGKANQPEPAYTYREVGVWDPDGRKFRTYREESLDGKAMYIKE